MIDRTDAGRTDADRAGRPDDPPDRREVEEANRKISRDQERDRPGRPLPPGGTIIPPD